jgi:hypothetical protein
MLEQQLELKFKGERKYLQGPDIFNETLAWLGSRKGEVKDIDFTFHRLAAHQLKVVSGAALEGAEPVAVCAYTTDGVRERVHLVETEQTVTGRYPYPEDEIVSSMELDLAGRKGLLHGEAAYSDIEVWVAMTKALHYKVFPHLKGKWLFVRGRFPQYMRHSTSDERVLIIVSSFNDKLTRSDALLDGVKVGEIYFSIV